MASQARSSAASAGEVVPRGFGRQALYVLLGFSAGLPFYMFSTVLSLRLQAHEVGLVVIGFFAWVQLAADLQVPVGAAARPLRGARDLAASGARGAAGSCSPSSASSSRWRRWRLTSSDENLAAHGAVRGACSPSGRRRWKSPPTPGGSSWRRPRRSRGRSPPPISGATAPPWSRPAAARCSSPTSPAGAGPALISRSPPPPSCPFRCSR